MIRKAIPATFALLLLAGCATGPNVVVDSDPNVDVSRYRTYSWAFSSTPRGMNPLTYQRVKTAIDANLSSRGYTQASPGDFAVGFTLGARDKVEVDTFGAYGPYYGRGWGYGWGGYGYAGGPQTYARSYTEGTLTIDIYDTGTKQPVWHGVASQEISASKVTQEVIDEAVAAVLAKFGAPPPAAK